MDDLQLAITLKNDTESGVQGLNAVADGFKAVSAASTAAGTGMAAANTSLTAAASAGAKVTSALSSISGGSELNTWATSSDKLTQSFGALSSVAPSVNNGLSKTSAEAAQASKSFNAYSTSIDDVTKRENNLVASTQKSVAALNNIKTATTGFNSSIEGAGSSLNKISSTGDKAAYTLLNVGRVAQDAPFGFIAIQNNLSPLIESFGMLVKSSGSVIGALGAIGSALTSVAGLGLLFNIAVAGFTVYSMATRKTKADTDELAESQKKVSDIVKEATASVQGEVATASALSKILLDTNKSYEARKAALNELKRIGGEYFNTLSLEKSSYEELKKASDSYSNSIIRQAVVKGLQKEIATVAEELAKTAPKNLETVGKAFMEFDKNFGKSNDSVRKSSKAIYDEIKDFGKKSSSATKTAGNDIGGNIADNITEGFEKKFGAEEKLKSRLQSLVDQLSSTIGGTDTPDKAKSTKNIKTVESVLQELSVAMRGVETDSKTLGLSFDELAGEKLAALNKAFDELKKLGLTETSPIMQNLAKQIDTLGTGIIGDKSIGLNLLTDKIVDGGDVLSKKDFSARLRFSTKDAEAEFRKFTRKVLGLEINNSDLDISGAQEKFNKSVDKLKEGAQDKLDRTTIVWGNLGTGLQAAVVDVAAQLRGAAAAVGTGIGEMIGNVITGKQSLGQALWGLVKIMGQFIKQFGQTLIEAATLRIIAEKTLFANPYVALAAGIGAVALGTVMENAIPSFAEGGIVEGKQLAWVGDNRGKKEALIPSEEWKNLTAGNGPVEVRGIISGNDILLVNARTNRNISRVNG